MPTISGTTFVFFSTGHSASPKRPRPRPTTGRWGDAAPSPSPAALSKRRPGTAPFDQRWAPGRLAPVPQHQRRGVSMAHRARRSACPPQLIGSKSRRPQTVCQWELPYRCAEDGIARGDTSTHQAQGQWQTVAAPTAAVWQRWEPTTGLRRAHGRVRHRDGTQGQQFGASRSGAVPLQNHDAMSLGVDRVAS